MSAYDLAPSLKDYRSEINQVWPGRDKASDGWIGDTSHAARPSDHNPDNSRPTPLVRAFDVDKDGPRSLDIGEAIAEHLRRSRDPRIKYVIWNGRMFSSYATSSRSAWQWGPYRGVNAHRAHVHLSVLGGATGARPGPWGLLDLAKDPTNPLRPPQPTTPAPVPPREDTDMHRIQVKAKGHPYDGRIYLVTAIDVKHLSGTQNTAWDHLPLFEVNQAEPDIMRNTLANSPLARAVTAAREGSDDVLALVEDLPAETAAVLLDTLRARLDG